MIGDITIAAYERTPEGHVPCDGRDLEIAKYPALFALIGNKFGGNGSTHFAVPKLNGAVFGVHFNIHATEDDFPNFEN